MKPLQVTPRQAQVLDLLCELGDTKLVAHRLKIAPRGVEQHIHRMITDTGHMNRLTFALHWDRQKRQLDCKQ